MAVKESSDLGTSVTARTLSDYLALSIATCGVGYLPLAPGTFGSLVGVGIFLLLVQRVSPLVIVGSILVITFTGIWAASRTEELSGRKDPGKVVVDEVAGQMIALLPLTVFAVTPLAVMVSFILFRFFDIVKPYPAGRLEGLKGGFGIMCDDLVAGGYAAVLAAVILAVI